jgi:hypothetical protein
MNRAKWRSSAEKAQFCSKRHPKINRLNEMRLFYHKMAGFQPANQSSGGFLSMHKNYYGPTVKTPRELCITAEKWFAGGESNVFRLSREGVDGLQCIMITAGYPLSGKDF